MLGYTKLCWLKGIRVKINNSLVPEQLPIEPPLEKYSDEYSYLYNR